MISKLLSAAKTSKFSLLKVNEQLSKTGLKKTGLPKDLVERLKKSLQPKNIDPSILSLDEADRKLLKKVDCIYILEEILKRNPNYSPSKKITKSQLIDDLNSVLLPDKVYFTDLKSLIFKSLSKPDNNSLKDYTDMLEDLSEAYKISQHNMNVLINTESNSMTYIWENIMNQLDSLSFHQTFTMLASIYNLENIFKKKFIDGKKINLVQIQNIVIQARKTFDGGKIVEVAKFLSLAHGMAGKKDFILEFQVEFLSRIKSLNEFEDHELIYLLENLPPGCYQDYKPIIDEIITRITKVLPEINYKTLLSGLFGLHTSGAKIPFSYIYNIDNIDKRFMKKLSPTFLSKILNVLSETNNLSEKIAKNIVES
jgi:hypothetical protein